MGAYIEKDLDQEYLCTTSGTIPINPSTTKSTGNKYTDENLERWDWLINGWDSMTFKERMALFMPHLHYVNLRNNYKVEFDEVLNKEITEFGYKLCRTFDDFKFDPDRQGIPNFIIVYNPIDVTSIPDPIVKVNVREWGIKYGFLHCGKCGRC